MSAVEVTTKEELEIARKSNAPLIVIKGDLADQLKRSKAILKISKLGLAFLTVAFTGAAITSAASGGFSLGLLAPAAAFTGLEVAAIITAVSLGLAMIIALFKGYEEISYEHGKMSLRRKQS